MRFTLFQKQVREWLSVVDFYNKTKFYHSHLIFCEKRLDKVEICRGLEVDCFIDDNIEIIDALENVVEKRIYFQKDTKWLEIYDLLVST